MRVPVCFKCDLVPFLLGTIHNDFPHFNDPNWMFPDPKQFERRRRQSDKGDNQERARGPSATRRHHDALVDPREAAAWRRWSAPVPRHPLQIIVASRIVVERVILFSPRSPISCLSVRTLLEPYSIRLLTSFVQSIPLHPVFIGSSRLFSSFSNHMILHLCFYIIRGVAPHIVPYLPFFSKSASVPCPRLSHKLRWPSLHSHTKYNAPKLFLKQ